MVIILKLYISITLGIEKTPYTIIAYGVFSYNYLLGYRTKRVGTLIPIIER